MTRLTNDPADFPAEALKGFIAANKRYVKPVYGGVARSTLTPAGKVAVVYGGGSGHYPAFAGWVGHGFADGAVCGNIFSSPSAAQAYSVLKAVHRGAGVLMGFGNYAGDVLHFGQAIERLRAEGIEADTLVVTDDIASGDAAEPEKRRGIAGDFPVFKITSAAAEAGLGFDEVRRVFARANAATRSFGVAFAGCTLPGAKGPLFTVPAGRMGIGLGIHGEPGVAEADLGSADDVARTLVEGLLEDRPAGAGDRVVAIVNGLGSSKYEELFVVTSCVVALLEAAGLECADVEAGEFVTSLDMAGVSLTLVWVDDELLGYWDAPCDAPAYRKGSVGSVERDDAALSQAAAPVEVTTPGSTASREAAEVAAGLLDDVAGMLARAQEELGALDSVAGDGDHGIGMANGARAAAGAARAAVSAGGGLRTTLTAAGDAWSALGDEKTPGSDDLAVALQAALSAVQRLGGAEVGDKTLVDALSPFVAAFVATDGDLAAKSAAAVVAAEAGTESTRALVARLGRARPLGEKSVGTPDPGAVSLTKVVTLLNSRLS